MNEEERHGLLREIFERAVSLDPSRVREYLDFRCGGDTSLRDEIESLLKAAATRDDAFCEQAIGDAERFAAAFQRSDANAENRRIPEAIGGCRIIRLLGAGGMGVVWEAEQRSPSRRVAIKVINSGAATPAFARRFRREAEVLARLRHPGIAQIHALGVDSIDGQETPFIVMELVSGRSLIEHAEASGLDTRARLRLFIAVCEAVEHAHQRGVIHRDLKPANILIDEQDQPKVLDFGIARVIETDPSETQETIAGQIIGTIAYMSPEQAAGDSDSVDTRSDVYALGVVLYELLTGRPPFVGANPSFLEHLRLIKEEDPGRLSAHDALLRGDLETITRKALEKSPERRYQSSRELAEDLQRYLTNRPILAHPPSTLYVFQKFSRRHRGLVIGSCVALAAMVMGFAATVWSLARESTQRERAESALVEARAALGVLETTLLSVTPEQAEGRDTELMELVLDEAHETAERDLADAHLVRARMFQLLGRAHGQLSDVKSAAELYEKSIEAYDVAGAPDDPDRLETMYWLAGMNRASRDYERARELMDESIGIFERAGGDPADHADHLVERGFVEMLNGDFDAALRYADEAVERLGDLEDRIEYVAVHVFRGNVLRRLGRMDEAEREYRLVIAYHDRDPDPDLTLVADVHNSLAILLRGTGRLEEAASSLRYALAARESLDPRPNRVTAALLSNLARTLLMQSEAQEALAVATRAEEVHITLFGENHIGVGFSRLALAGAHDQLGDAARAIDTLRGALSSFAASVGEKSPHVVDTQIRIGEIARRSDRIDEARDALTSAVRTSEEISASSLQLAALRELADLEWEAGEFTRGIDLLNRAIELAPPGHARHDELRETLEERRATAP